MNPTNIPFADGFIDYLGPYVVKQNNSSSKVWILCVTCLWTRAINLKKYDLNTAQFLRSFQLHAFEYGVPQMVISDLGTQLVAGADLIGNFLKDWKTDKYFRENNAAITSFSQYCKGKSELGSSVEVCIKITKRLIYGAIIICVLSISDSEFLVAEVVCLLNKRPITFKESLRSSDILPDPITPELLIRGHDLLSVNVVPHLQPDPNDRDWSKNLDHVSHVRDTYSKLKAIRKNLVEKYNEEFIATLIKQATDKKDRYRTVKNDCFEVGDIVLVKEEDCKLSNYPMAIVKSIKTNDLEEVTDAKLLKRKSNEII